MSHLPVILLLLCLQITGSHCQTYDGHVPGWAIALLVLAAVMLFILLVGFVYVIALRRRRQCH